MAATIPPAGISTYNGATSDADLGAGLHIKTADSGLSSIAGGGDELIIEGSGDSGLSILSGASSDGNIFFGDSGDADNAYITYDHSTAHLHIGHGGVTKSNASLLFHGSDLAISTNGELDGDAGRGGICLNQGGGDGNILTFKSSDVAQNMTSQAEADTYFFARKKSSTAGGVKMAGLTDTGDGHAFEIAGFQAQENTSESTGASSAVCVNGFKRDGTSVNVEAIPDQANVFGIKNNDNMQCLFKGDGEIHTNTAGGSNVGSVSTYDEYEDAQLVRAFDLSKGHYARGLIDSQFDKFVKYNTQDLVDANIIGTDDEGNPTSFVNITGLQRLHNGAIWQQYEKHQRLAEAVYEMAKEALGKDKADAILEKHDIKLLN
mgnify:CR=1 FL=1